MTSCRFTMRVFTAINLCLLSTAFATPVTHGMFSMHWKVKITNSS
jgi:hypothetical protein